VAIVIHLTLNRSMTLDDSKLNVGDSLLEGGVINVGASATFNDHSGFSTLLLDRATGRHDNPGEFQANPRSFSQAIRAIRQMPSSPLSTHQSSKRSRARSFWSSSGLTSTTHLKGKIIRM